MSLRTRCLSRPDSGLGKEHLSVKTIKRSAGRSATAAAAYRAGAAIACDREGRLHDYTARHGVLASFLLAPDGAPAWAGDRAALWNAAEARETRSNSVTAREWELALPAGLSDAERLALARGFAQSLVDRYGVAADVAIHAPHREGDQRNHHCHILTTTRVMTSAGLTDKTRVLDAAATGGPEIEAMRAAWAEMQNSALAQADLAERVDHRSLEAQRAAALERGDELAAEALDRAPEVKLGPAASALERRAQRSAEAEGVPYEPVTERGAAVHAARQARSLFEELRARLLHAREVWAEARAQEASALSAALEAAKALFVAPEADSFAAGFQSAWVAQETQRQLDAARADFVERAATAWERVSEIDDQDEAALRYDGITRSIDAAARQLGVPYNDLAAEIDQRVEEIVEEERAELAAQLYAQAQLLAERERAAEQAKAEADLTERWHRSRDLEDEMEMDM